MISRELARRYANSLFELAAEASLLDKVDLDLHEVTKMLVQNNELKLFLNHPNIQPADKKEVMGKILDGNVSDLCRRFIFLLIDHHRQYALETVRQEFSALANEARGIAVAKVTSAARLSSDQKEKLRRTVEKSTGKSVRIISAVDPDLIGGVMVQVGDRLMDGTVLTALSKLRKELLKSSTNLQQEIEVG